METALPRGIVCEINVVIGGGTAQKERDPGSGSQGVGQVSLVLDSGLKYVFHWLRSQNQSVFLSLAQVSEQGWVSLIGSFTLHLLLLLPRQQLWKTAALVSTGTLMRVISRCASKPHSELLRTSLPQ